MDETGLVRDAINGDLDAFNRLVLAYQDMAFNLAYRMLGDPAQAEDATQDSFISAYRHLNSYRGGSFKAWVMRMVTNTCYDELRRQHRHPGISLEPVNDEDEEVESPSWMVDSTATPQTLSELAELDKAVQHCLGGLPPEFRSVVVMVDIQGMDYEEAAQSTNTPLGTVKSRLARARLKLRMCLQGFGELIPSAFRQEDEGSS
jgi:RNA polymerase sigma-70 factor, ECF subfamily